MGGKWGEGFARYGFKYDNGAVSAVEDEEGASFGSIKVAAVGAAEASAVAPTGRGWLCVPS